MFGYDVGALTLKELYEVARPCARIRVPLTRFSTRAGFIQGATSPAASKSIVSAKLEGVRVPVSTLEVWPTLGGQSMSKILRRTWSLVVNAVRAYRLYEFLRDHFDNQR